MPTTFYPTTTSRANNFTSVGQELALTTDSGSAASGQTWSASIPASTNGYSVVSFLADAATGPSDRDVNGSYTFSYRVSASGASCTHDHRFYTSDTSGSNQVFQSFSSAASGTGLFTHTPTISGNGIIGVGHVPLWLLTGSNSNMMSTETVSFSSTDTWFTAPWAITAPSDPSLTAASGYGYGMVDWLDSAGTGATTREWQYSTDNVNWSATITTTKNWGFLPWTQGTSVYIRVRAVNSIGTSNWVTIYRTANETGFTWIQYLNTGSQGANVGTGDSGAPSTSFQEEYNTGASFTYEKGSSITLPTNHTGVCKATISSLSLGSFAGKVHRSLGILRPIVRQYVMFPTFPSVQVSVLDILDTNSANIVGLKVSSSGVLEGFFDSNGTSWGSYQLSTNTWYRLELVTRSDGNYTHLEWKVYAGESSTALYTRTTGNISRVLDKIGYFRYGIRPMGGTISSAWTYYFDDPGFSIAQVSSDGYWGPSVSTTPPDAPAGPLTVSSISSSGAIFDWDDVSGASTYDLWISINSNFSTGDATAFGLTSSGTTFNLLQPSTTYYWRVRASNGFGDSAWTAAGSSFTTSAGPVTYTGAVALNAAGSLSVAATRTTTGGKALNAPAALSSAGARETSGSKALNAPGVLTIQVGQTAGATLNAPAALASAGTRTTTGSEGLNAPAALTAAGSRTTTGSEGLTAPAALSVAATRQVNVAANLNAPAQIVPNSGQQAASNLNAPALLSISSTGRTTFGAVTLAAPGALSPAGTRTTTGSVALQAAADLDATATRVRFGDVDLNAPAALAAAQPGRTTFGAEDLLAPGLLTVGATQTSMAASQLNAAASLAADADIVIVGQVDLTAPGAIDFMPGVIETTTMTFPDEIITQTGLTGPLSYLQSDPSQGTSEWLTSSVNTNTLLRVGFPDPLGPLSGVQGFRVRVRKTTGTTNPTVVVRLLSGGSTIATLVTSTSVTGETMLTGSYNAEGTDPSTLQLEIAGTVGGGTPAQRAAVEVGAVAWDVQWSAVGPGVHKQTTGSVSLEAAGALLANVGASGQVDLSAAASLDTDGVVVKWGAADLDAPANLSSNPTRIAPGAVALNAAAAMSVGFTPITKFGASNLNAAAALVVNPAHNGKVNLNAPGALAVGPFAGRFAASNLNAAANLSSAGTRTTTTATALNAAAAMSVGFTPITKFGASNLSAPGFLLANAGAAGSVALNAAAALAVGPFASRFGASTLNAPGNLSTAATRTTTGATALNAAAAMSVGFTPLTKFGAVNLNAAALLASNAAQTGYAQLLAPGRLVSQPFLTMSVAANLVAAALLQTSPTRIAIVATALNAAGNLSATGTRITPGTVTLIAPGVLAVSSVHLANVGASLLAAARLSIPSTGRTTFGAVALLARGNLAAAALSGQSGAVVLLARGNLASNPTRIAVAAVSLLARGNLSSAPVRLGSGSAALNARGFLAVAGMKLLIQVRSPLSGQLVPAIVRVRSAGAHPFMVPRIVVRETGVSPWQTVQPGNDQRLLEIAQGPVYSGGGDPLASQWFWKDWPEFYGPTSKPVFRMERIPGTVAGWGSYIAAGLRGGSIPAGRQTRIRWRGRGNGGTVTTHIVNDPAQRNAASFGGVALGDQWQTFVQTATLLEEWTSLDVNASTGYSQRFRFNIGAPDTSWAEVSDIHLEVVG